MIKRSLLFMEVVCEFKRASNLISRELFFVNSKSHKNDSVNRKRKQSISLHFPFAPSWPQSVDPSQDTVRKRKTGRIFFSPLHHFKVNFKFTARTVCVCAFVCVVASINSSSLSRVSLEFRATFSSSSLRDFAAFEKIYFFYVWTFNKTKKNRCKFKYLSRCSFVVKIEEIMMADRLNGRWRNKERNLIIVQFSLISTFAYTPRRIL